MAPLEEKKRRAWFPFGGGSVKTLLLVTTVVGLALTNVASLVSGSLHDLMYSGLSRVLQIAGSGVAEKALRRSPTAVAENAKRKTSGLIDENEKLRQGNKKLDDDLRATRAEADTLKSNNRKLKANVDDLSARNRTFAQAAERKIVTGKKIASKVRTRMAIGAFRNVAGLPAEAVPVIGVGVIVAITAMDVYDSCQTVKDMNELLRMLGAAQEDERDVCGVRVPTAPEVRNEVWKTWDRSMETVARGAKEFPTKVSLPEIRLPTAGEVLSSVCPIVKLPAYCAG